MKKECLDPINTAFLAEDQEALSRATDEELIASYERTRDQGYGGPARHKWPLDVM